MHALDKLFLKSQPLADRWRAIFHCKQTIGEKISQQFTEKENERFAANTADRTQDDYFVIAILEMCTDPELSKKFRGVKTNELTWEKLRDVAENYGLRQPGHAGQLQQKKLEKEPERTKHRLKAMLQMQH